MHGNAGGIQPATANGGHAGQSGIHPHTRCQYPGARAIGHASTGMFHHRPPHGQAVGRIDVWRALEREIACNFCVLRQIGPDPNVDAFVLWIQGNGVIFQGHSSEHIHRFIERHARHWRHVEHPNALQLVHDLTVGTGATGLVGTAAGLVNPSRIRDG